MIPRRFTAFDFFLIVLLLTGAALGIPILLSSHPSTVRIYRDNKLIAEYPLSKEKTVRLQGNTGQVTLRIAEGSARVIEADCDKQVCLQSGKISNPFEQIVCAPNHLLIKIKNSTESDSLDAVAR